MAYAMDDKSLALRRQHCHFRKRHIGGRDRARTYPFSSTCCESYEPIVSKPRRKFSPCLLSSMLQYMHTVQHVIPPRRATRKLFAFPPVMASRFLLFPPVQSQSFFLPQPRRGRGEDGRKEFAWEKVDRCFLLSLLAEAAAAALFSSSSRRFSSLPLMDGFGCEGGQEEEEEGEEIRAWVDRQTHRRRGIEEKKKGY